MEENKIERPLTAFGEPLVVFETRLIDNINVKYPDSDVDRKYLEVYDDFIRIYSDSIKTIGYQKRSNPNIEEVDCSSKYDVIVMKENIGSIGVYHSDKEHKIDSEMLPRYNVQFNFLDDVVRVSTFKEDQAFEIRDFVLKWKFDKI